MLSSPRSKFVTITIFLALLVALFVWTGTIDPVPADNNYSGTGDIHESPDRYVGEEVSVGGTVVDTDPLTIEDEPIPGERTTFTIEHADPDVTVGDTLSVFGTLQSNNHVGATNVVHREPWEAQYMYVVSSLAGLIVLGRLCNHWTVDTTTWSIVPRPTPLLTRTD